MIDGRRRRSTTATRTTATSEGVTAPRSRPQRFGLRVARLGISANTVTVAGIALAALTALAIALGHLWIGVLLLTIGGLMDTLDGLVAKVTGSASPRGAFFDSVADRVADGLIFGGVAWHLLDGPDPKLAVLPIAILGVSALVSYERAKAESLGFSGKGGLMERAERLILLGIALFFHGALVPLLIVLLALTTATAIGRFARVWREASGDGAERVTRDGRRVRVGHEWQAWRAASQSRPRRRVRSRRELEPLATRLRKVISTPRPVGTARRGSTERPGSAGRRGSTGRQRAARAFRERFDTPR